MADGQAAAGAPQGGGPSPKASPPKKRVKKAAAKKDGDGARSKWTMAELEKLPMRDSCLRTHTRFSDVEGSLRVRLLTYFSTAVPALPELAGAVLELEKIAPQFLRLKELIESVEAFLLIVCYLNTAESADKKHIDTFYDLACGHGLVGVLLAYAFPTRTVVACDRAEREAFTLFNYVFQKMRERQASSDKWTPESIDWVAEAAFVPADRPRRTEGKSREYNAQEAHNRAARGKAELEATQKALETVAAAKKLPNLEFVHANIEEITPRVTSTSLVVALHGCNEANKDSIEMAKASGALWCVLPCCMKYELYLPLSVVTKLSDDARYAFLCGVISHMYGAQMVRTIDRRITARAIMACGGISNADKKLHYMSNTNKLERERALADAAPPVQGV
eukprot:TRINITY_DN24980_c0_g1_i1.p1 TRINITY_DN24980_c0_g1~~TRINITY_DN24980_c0_g1_i1.p1  ORF type:complete len:414 (+),score=129.05 TRINITY_DN24980_c0_g1_i1:65-1243(+)